LGLYVVQRLVRNLGGRIHAESAGRDRGTTMRIQLPLGTADRAGAG
jgi:signal transduction histidine kinase